MNQREKNIVAAPAADTLAGMSLRRGDFKVLVVSSMEQIIGAVLSTLVGIVMPLMQLTDSISLSSLMQGVIGSAGLIGISIGSMFIGRLMDSQGYLRWFRICPVLITVGALIPFLFHTPWMLVIGMFIAGLGVGGGYSLDSSYISEIVPERWRQLMVGMAKASCAIGFAMTAGLCWWILTCDRRAEIWPWLLLILAGLGALTFLMRLRWYDSPVWLMAHGRSAEAQKAIEFFVGKGIKTVPPVKSDTGTVKWGDMFRGRNLLKVVYSGFTWACEGLGVYGFGVFLPVMIMALGIEHETARGIDKVINSVEMTFYINLFIIPGFTLGLILMHRVNRAAMMGTGFIGSFVGLLLLFFAYLWHWPVWLSVVAFLLFELSLQSGPHLVTYIIPSTIYSVEERGAGTGIAAMMGKVGAVMGVFFMPLLLDAGGMTLVLIVSMAVMLLGALLTFIFGKLLGQFKTN